jgi:hypothetical protein
MKLRARVMLVGGIMGALVGLAAAFLFLQANPVHVDEEGKERLPAIQTGKALSVGLGLLTVIRQLVGLSAVEQGGKGGRRGH